MNAEAVLDALSQVLAPGSDESIVALGYVKDIDAGDAPSFRVEFPGPLTPARQGIEARCREALGEAGAGAQVRIESRIPATFAGTEGKP